MISVTALTTLVYLAVAAGTLIPVVLIIMVYLDWKRGRLW